MPDAPPALRLVNRHTGEVLELTRHLEAGVPVLRLQGSLPPRQEGPPRHVHHLEDEEGRVTAGVLTAQVGGETLQFTPGESVRLPRGVPHRWWNAGDEPLAFEGWARPVVDLDRYLQGVFEIMNAGPPGRPPLFYLAHLAVRHRRTQTVLLMPGPLQAAFFRVVVFVGTLLGRYRGDGWPGAPDRCPGAAEPAATPGRPEPAPRLLP
ncbi:MAG: cupin domain-containing protein [Gemmatimonadales bacterium]